MQHPRSSFPRRILPNAKCMILATQSAIAYSQHQARFKHHPKELIKYYRQKIFHISPQINFALIQWVRNIYIRQGISKTIQTIK